MADTAAHLVDRVLPEVPIRQWVLTLPIPLRYRVAYDRDLCSAVLGAFLGTVFSFQRRRARRLLDLADGKTGSVTFIQRSGGAINLNVHYHVLVIDGVYAAAEGTKTPTFSPLPPPDDDEIARVTAAIAKRIVRLLKRRGLLVDEGAPAEDPLLRDEPLLAGCASASIRQRIATGPRRGQAVMRLGDRIEAEDVESVPGKRCASVQGFSLHAGVAVEALDRERLERLCRYVSRSPVATERLSELPDGRIAYELRHPWRDGTTHVVFTGTELVEKLAVLVPFPRGNSTRYHGILAPGAKWRSAVIRDRRSSRPRTPASSSSVLPPAMPAREFFPLRERRLSWADLIRRVFSSEVLSCPRCSGRCRVIATITQPEVIRAILKCLGLPARAPPIAPARISPQICFEL
jgi:hypothetical protein